MAAAKSTRKSAGGKVPNTRVVQRRGQSNPADDDTRKYPESSLAVNQGQRPAAYTSKKRHVSRSAPRAAGVEGGAPPPLSQLHRRLESTAKKIGGYSEEMSRLRAHISRQLEERARLRMEKKVPSLEQAIAESSERRVDPSLLRRFQMSDTARTYTGAEGDRKAMLAHRQEVQMRARELDREKEAFLKEIRERAILARNRRLAEHSEVDNAVIETRRRLKEVEARLQSCKEDEASLVEAIASARKDGATLSFGVGSRGRGEPRNHVDDSLLSDSKVFRFHPSWLDVKQSSRKIKLVKVSDNLLLIGTKAFGTKVPSSDELERMISYMANHKGESKRLRTLYQSLIKLLIVDDVESNAGTARSYWVTLISAGCWPEIIRRFILLRKLSNDTPDYQRPGREVSEVAGLLGQDNIESLTLDKHILLLHYLGDTVLVDSSRFRDAIVARECANGEKKRDIQANAKQSSSGAQDVGIREIEMQVIENPDSMTRLGMDRYHRRYWWGLGGVKSVILVEDTHEFVALVTSEAELNELLESLDVRGKREKELHRNVLVVKDAMVRAIELNKKKDSSKGDESTDEEAQVQPVRQSSRHTRQAEFYDPTMELTKPYENSRPRERPREISDRLLAAQLSSIDQDLPASVLTSMVETILTLSKIGREAAQLGIPSSTKSSTNFSWELFHNTVVTFGLSYGSEEYKRLTLEHMTETLRSQICFLEEILDGESRLLQGVKDKRDAPDLGLDQIDVLAPPAPRHHPRTSIYLWNTMKERSSWLTDVAASSCSSPSRLNYAARVLHMRAVPLLAKLGAGT